MDGFQVLSISLSQFDKENTQWILYNWQGC